MGTKKLPSLPGNIEGTRVNLSHPWCHPNCLSYGSGLQLCRAGEKTSFLVVLSAWEPSTRPTCCAVHARFLRPAAHECVLQRVLPFRTFTMHRIAVGLSLAYFFRSTRVNLLVLMC